MIPTHHIRLRFFTDTPDGMKQTTEEFIPAYSLEEAEKVFDQQVALKEKGMGGGGMWAYMVSLIDLSTKFILREKTVKSTLPLWKVCKK